MSPEERILETIIKSKEPDECVAFVVPRKDVFSSAQREALRRKFRVHITESGLHYDSRDCIRLAGCEFTNVYFYTVPKGSFCDEYMITRLRGRNNKLQRLHYYYY